MTNHWLLNILGDVDADLVEEAGQPLTVRKRSPLRWTAAVAAVLVMAVCLGALFGHRSETPPVSDPDTSVSDTSQEDTTTEDTTTTTQTTTTTTAQNLPSRVFAMAIPSYPALSAPDDYWQKWEEEQQKRERLEQNADGMTAFYADTMAALLKDGDGKNRVYSPLTLYMALGVLAETAAGDSRQQILNLLGQENLAALRDKTNALWEGLYRDDELVTCRFGNSLWLRQDDKATYRQDTLDALAQQYYAAAYRGEMGSEEYNSVLRDWLNDHTGGLLSQQVESVKLNPNTALALVSTLHFRGIWMDEFEEFRDVVFHGYDGDTIHSMMYRELSDSYFWGDHFLCARVTMKEMPSMYVFLPNEGESVESLLDDPQVLAVIQDDDYANKEDAWVRLTMPRFDITSDLDLKESLSRLGVTDVFDAEKADFSGILAEQGGEVTLDRVRHATRVAVDEKGVTAAAFVEMEYGMGGGPDANIDFVVDRPFLFIITGADTLLFAGVVENLQ